VTLAAFARTAHAGGGRNSRNLADAGCSAVVAHPHLAE